MKKLVIAVIALGMISMSSCKKEESATPSSKTQTVKVADKRDLGSYD